MSIHVTERDGIVIIALAGKIMGGPEAGQINEQINNLIDQGKIIECTTPEEFRRSTNPAVTNFINANRRNRQKGDLA